MVHTPPIHEFKSRIEDSPLLSRGWVYQEIILAPANLFCTDTQMWWSCSHATTSEALPLGATQDARSGIEAHDAIQDSKQAIIAPGDTSDVVGSWIVLLRSYVITSLTFGDDRLVALMGLVKRFRTLYPNELGSASYHSGLWSTDVLWQLSWFPIVRNPGLSSQISTKYHIPSWSPLGSTRGFTNIEPSRASFLPVRFVGWTGLERFEDTSPNLDNFGRASHRKDCQLYLQGVLISLRFGITKMTKESTQIEMHPTGLEGRDTSVQLTWDCVEDKEFSVSHPNTDYRALMLSSSAGALDLAYYLHGILLRPYKDDNNFLAPDRIRHRVWVRCGFLRGHMNWDGSVEIAEKRVQAWEEAYQITQRYGLQWKVDNSGSVNRYQWRWKRVSTTGPLPKLDDIYIV